MNYAETKKRRTELKNKLEHWKGRVQERTELVDKIHGDIKEKMKMFSNADQLTHAETSQLQADLLQLKKDQSKATQMLSKAMDLEEETQNKLLKLEG